MQRPDALAPTAPVHPVAPAPPTRSGRGTVAAAAAAGLLLGLLLGILIGRAGGDAAPPPQPAPGSGAPLAQLVVKSEPVEANVIIDGRFVGVAPVERIDLDPGKHSIVVDAFGYQPYAGTFEIEASARGSLKIVLAPLGGSGTSSTGEYVVGGGGRKGKATVATVPPSALAPITLSGTGASREGGKPARPRRSSSAASSSPPPPPAYEPPPRPRRDCSGEKSRCRDSCSRANGDCRFNCPNCVSCPSSVGWDECKRQCESCRSGCEQNVKFCESTCDGNYNSCTASQ